MPNDRFKIGQSVLVTHKDALGFSHRYPGKVAEYVDHDTWYIDIATLGLRILFAEGDIDGS